ncbi:hypothetical protein RRSWK_02773 [Rhodopirellula sp. SWK7]|nr:hypothetical protein RRSWK_02773 [Rhodopirellula sp. SWK7]
MRGVAAKWGRHANASSDVACPMFAERFDCVRDCLTEFLVDLQN